MSDMDNVVTCTSFASSLLSFSGWTGRAVETAAHVKSKSERSFILTLVSVLVGEQSAFCSMCILSHIPVHMVMGCFVESAVD